MIVSSERGTWDGHKRMITQEKSFVSIVEVDEKQVHDSMIRCHDALLSLSKSMSSRVFCCNACHSTSRVSVSEGEHGSMHDGLAPRVVRGCGCYKVDWGGCNFATSCGRSNFLVSYES